MANKDPLAAGGFAWPTHVIRPAEFNASNARRNGDVSGEFIVGNRKPGAKHALARTASFAKVTASTAGSALAGNFTSRPSSCGFSPRPRAPVLPPTSDGASVVYDTNHGFETVNLVSANGASIIRPGPVVVGGMLYVNSGCGGYGGRPGNVLLPSGGTLKAGVQL